MRVSSLLAVFSFALTLQAAPGDVSWQTDDPSRDAFSQLYPTIDREMLDQARQGRNLFRQSWVIAPAADIETAGLGPLYNQLSCLACHPKNGRGSPPETPDQAIRSMLVRLSLPGRNGHGGPVPDPVYGDQLNEQGVPGVQGEGRVRVVFREFVEIMPDGEAIRLRRPEYEFVELSYGPLPKDMLFSPRVGPPVFGLGLLEAVSDDTIRHLAERGRIQGLNGRPNLVWDSERQRAVVGRFGLKANVATLKQQIAGAFIGDMGITSSLYPAENCSPVQTACRKAPPARRPELDDAQLEAVLTYLRLLQAPARRNVYDAGVRRGEMLFTEIGCADCHTPTLRTGGFPELPVLSRQTFHPYTDLLIHDMGEALADGRPDFEAGGRDWRTPPLWGIGLLEKINGHTHLLHDGRARNVKEAILWHGGEAELAKQRFERLSSFERQDLIHFLESL